MLQRVTSVLLILSATAAVSVGIAFQQVGPSPSAQLDKTDGPQQSLAIVVNQSNPINDLSLEELRKIFLGERSHWPNGRRITLVMIEPGRPERTAMLHGLYHMTESDLNRHFLHGLFTGQVFVSPKTLNTPVGVCKFVFNVPGAIGYVRASDVDDSVRVIRIDGHVPQDRDYSLRIAAAVK
jgi:ABC-type phosphate transport system substrate-binding protein